MEENTLGFNIFQSDDLNGERLPINPELIPNKYIAGTGSKYQFTDTDIQLGTVYYYWLEFIESSGTTEFGPRIAEMLGNKTYLPVIQSN